MPGMLVSICGNEGSGKSTLIPWLAEELRSYDRYVVETREPGGTPMAEKIREILLWNEDEVMHPDTELLLVYAARSQHYRNLIIPVIENDGILISDRFNDSSRALQGFGRGMSQERIKIISDFVLDGFLPKLTILLDLPVELGASRAAARGKLDRFEKEGVEFFTNVRKGFLQMAKEEPARFRVIDASVSLEEVKDQVRRIIPEILSLHRPT